MDHVASLGAFLTSVVLVVPFVAFLGPRLLSLAGGAIFVALAAILLEVLGQNALQPLYVAAVVLIFVAPLAEELPKFLDSGLTGANCASAAAARRALAEAVARRDSSTGVCKMAHLWTRATPFAALPSGSIRATRPWWN